MPAKWTTVVIDALDPERLGAFWGSVLGWQRQTLAPDDPAVAVGDAERVLPLLLFVPAAAAKTGKNRIHLDLNPVGVDQRDELDRLLALGAHRVDIGQGDAAWVVLADPEGNEFCLLARRHETPADEQPGGAGSPPVYPEAMPAGGRYVHCPHCTSPLEGVSDDDGIQRAQCPSCAWTYFPANVLGVNVVPITDDERIAMILPPGEPEHAPAALPGGVIEYGEAPEHAAVRETLEETGLVVEITRELGRWFNPRFPYGPMLSFMFQARVTGGQLRDSHEGAARLYPLGTEPAVSPQRHGSRRAYDAYLQSRDTDR